MGLFSFGSKEKEEPKGNTPIHAASLLMSAPSPTDFLFIIVRENSPQKLPFL